MKVNSIIEIIEKLFHYKIKYGKAWRAKQRAWKMIYGDWEEAYEKLPALFNAMKAANLACIMSTSQNRMNGGMGDIFSSVLSGVFHSPWRPSGIVGRCFPLMVHFSSASIWAHY